MNTNTFITQQVPHVTQLPPLSLGTAVCSAVTDLCLLNHPVTLSNLPSPNSISFAPQTLKTFAPQTLKTCPCDAGGYTHRFLLPSAGPPHHGGLLVEYYSSSWFVGNVWQRRTGPGKTRITQMETARRERFERPSDIGEQLMAGVSLAMRPPLPVI